MGQFSYLVGGASWSILGKLLQFALGLAAIAIIARVIGPAAYGAFALGWIVIGLVDVMVSWAPSDTLIQRRQVSQGHFNATLIGSLTVAVIAGLLIAWQADTLAHWLNGGALLAMILPVRALLLPLSALSVGPIAMLMRASRFKAIAGLRSVAAIVSNALAVVMVLSGAGIWSLVAMELVNALVMLVIAWKLSGWRPGVRCRLGDFRDLLAFNLSTWASWGLQYAESQLPRLFIGTMLGAQAAGYYSLAQRLFDQITQVAMVPVYQVVQAGCARHQHDRDAVARLGEGATRMLSVLAFPLFLGVSAVAGVLVPGVFGDEWIGAVIVVQVLMLAGMRMALSMVQLAIIRGMGKPHWEAGSALLAVLLTGTLLWWVVPMGPAAAAMAVVVSAYVVWPLEAWFVSRVCGLSIRRQAGASAPAAICAIVTAVLVWAMMPGLFALTGTVSALLLGLAAGALIYWLMLALLIPEAARLIKSVLAAALRGDIAAVRRLAATLGGA